MADVTPKNQRLRIYFNQVWGSVRTEARSFGIAEGDVLAGTDARARLPLFGFQLPEESYRIAAWEDQAVRVYPPPGARIEQADGGQALRPVARDALPKDPQGPYLRLGPGHRLRLAEGDQSLVVNVEEQRDRAGWDRQQAAFWLIFLVAVTLGAPLAFLLARPDAELVQRALTEARADQGLAEVPEPIDLEVPEEGSPHGKGQVIPASVR